MADPEEKDQDGGKMRSLCVLLPLPVGVRSTRSGIAKAKFRRSGRFRRRPRGVKYDVMTVIPRVSWVFYVAF